MRGQHDFGTLNGMAQHLTRPDKTIFLKVNTQECWPRRAEYARHEMGYWDGYNEKVSAINYCSYQNQVQSLLLDFGAPLGWDILNCEKMSIKDILSDAVLVIENGS